jgi:hypothetical protein
LLNAALAIAILHLISQVHLPSFVKMLQENGFFVAQTTRHLLRKS